MQKQESQPGHVHICLLQWWKIQEYCYLILWNLLSPQLLFLWLQIKGLGSKGSNFLQFIIPLHKCLLELLTFFETLFFFNMPIS